MITGSPYVELNRCSYIQSSSGYTARIDYSGKGWLSGKRNTITAVLYPEGKEKEVLYTITGQWNEKLDIKQGTSKKVVETYDATKHKTTPLQVAPHEEQDDLESRKAWCKVAQAILVGDMDTTSREKSLIENRQRELRKVEKEEGREWQRIFFSRTETFPVFEALAAKIGENIDSDKTNGVWKFDLEKAKTAKKPYCKQNDQPITKVDSA